MPNDPIKSDEESLNYSDGSSSISVSTICSLSKNKENLAISIPKDFSLSNDKHISRTDILLPNKTLGIKEWSIMGLNTIGAFAAGTVTYLLHDEHKIAQSILLTNAFFRTTLGPMSFLPKSKAFEIGMAVAKIALGAGYAVATTEVNLKTGSLFDGTAEWEFPNQGPFISFEISSLATFIAGICNFSRVLFTNKDSKSYNFLIKLEQFFDLLCTGTAVLGGAYLWNIKELASRIVAPAAAMVDGGTGLLNTIIAILSPYWGFNNSIENQFEDRLPIFLCEMNDRHISESLNNDFDNCSFGLNENVISESNNSQNRLLLTGATVGEYKCPGANDDATDNSTHFSEIQVAASNSYLSSNLATNTNGGTEYSMF